MRKRRTVPRGTDTRAAPDPRAAADSAIESAGEQVEEPGAGSVEPTEVELGAAPGADADEGEGSAVAPDAGSDAVLDATLGAELDGESATAPDAGLDADLVADLSASFGIRFDAESDAARDVDPDAESAAEFGADPVAQASDELDADPGAKPGIEQNADSGPKSESAPDADLVAEAGSSTDLGPEAASESGSEDHPEAADNRDPDSPDLLGAPDPENKELMQALRQLNVRRSRNRDLTIGAVCAVLGLVIGLIIGNVTAGSSTTPAAAVSGTSRGALPNVPTQVPGTSAAPQAASTTSAGAVTFLVSGTAPGGVLISYGTNSTGKQSTKLPFTATMPLDNSGAVLYYDVYAQLHGSGNVTCSIAVNGQVIKSGTASTDSDICSAQIAQVGTTGQWEGE
jgi:hypothetical protein